MNAYLSFEVLNILVERWQSLTSLLHKTDSQRRGRISRVIRFFNGGEVLGW